MSALLALAALTGWLVAINAKTSHRDLVAKLYEAEAERDYYEKHCLRLDIAQRRLRVVRDGQARRALNADTLAHVRRLDERGAPVLSQAARGFGLLRSDSGDSDLSPITGGPDSDTECVTPPEETGGAS